MLKISSINEFLICNFPGKISTNVFAYLVLELVNKFAKYTLLYFMIGFDSLNVFDFILGKENYSIKMLKLKSGHLKILCNKRGDMPSFVGFLDKSTILRIR